MKNHALTLGDFELTVVSDGLYRGDGGAFFGVVPKVMWQRKTQPDELNRLAIGLNSLLVRTGKLNVLIDTGIGNKLPEKQKRIWEAPEKLLDNLRETGVAPEEIDIVINTHLHFDHCGWNTVHRDGRAVATFARAKYYAPEGEWRHGQLQLERDRVSYISDNYNPLIDSGQMQLLNGQVEIVPGISVVPTPGHTRSMNAVMIQSGGKTACYISDLLPTSWHLDPIWILAYDLFPLETIENKKKYYERAIPEQWLTIFTHDPDIPWAYLDREAGKIALKKV